MKSWVFAAFLISGCALVACGDDNTDQPTSSSSSGSGSGGSGASGGSGGNGGNGGNGGSGGEAGASTTSSSSTGIPTCDDSTDTCGSDTNTGCFKCAADGACKEFIDACGADEACKDLVRCISRCSDEEDPAPCVDECRTTNEAAVETYDAIAKCTICEQCATNCGASEVPLCTM